MPRAAAGIIQGMTITATDLQGMVTHWLGCPPNGYLGSPYGSDVERLLQSPFAAGVADSLIAKLREDIPVIGQLGPSDINIYAQQQGADRMMLAIDVAGTFVRLDGGDRGVPEV